MRYGQDQDLDLDMTDQIGGLQAVLGRERGTSVRLCAVAYKITGAFEENP